MNVWLSSIFKGVTARIKPLFTTPRIRSEINPLFFLVHKQAWNEVAEEYISTLSAGPPINFTPLQREIFFLYEKKKIFKSRKWMKNKRYEKKSPKGSSTLWYNNEKQFRKKKQSHLWTEIKHQIFSSMLKLVVISALVYVCEFWQQKELNALTSFFFVSILQI